MKGDAELLEEIVIAFIDDYPGKLMEMRRVIETRQPG